MRIRPVAFALCLLAFACGVTAAEPAKISLQAELTSISGQVEVFRNGEWQGLKLNDMLNPGDGVKTGADGRCTIEWAGKVLAVSPLSVINLGELSVIPSQDEERSVINVKVGGVYAKVQKLVGGTSVFQLKTPTAVAGVRGTTLITEVDKDGNSEFTCVTGKIAVFGKSGKEVYVAGGWKTTVVKNGDPTKPVKADDKKLEDFMSTESVSSPSLQIIKPTGSIDTQTGGVLVHGRTEPGAAVDVNGSKLTANPQGFFTLLLYLEDGSNEIKVTVTNEKGLSTTKSLNVNYSETAVAADDQEAEEEFSETAGGTFVSSGGVKLSISYPPEKLLTRKENVTISGTKSTGAKVLVNGADSGSEPGSPGFMAQVELVEEGENIITVAATKGENAAKAILKITKDTTPPMLEIIRPSMGQFDITTGDCVIQNANLALCTIVGFTESGASLIINNIRYEVEDDGSFNNMVLLNPRNAVLLVNAEDEAGNRTTKVITRTLRDITEAYYMTLSVDPAIIGSNGTTAILTINGKDYLGQPLTGSVVNVSTTQGILLGSESVVLNNGIGTTTITPDPNYNMTMDILSVTITAVSVDTVESTVMTIKDVPCNLDDLDDPANLNGNCGF